MDEWLPLRRVRVGGANWPLVADPHARLGRAQVYRLRSRIESTEGDGRGNRRLRRFGTGRRGSSRESSLAAELGNPCLQRLRHRRQLASHQAA